jgi:hypothetical protein
VAVERLDVSSAVLGLFGSVDDGYPTHVHLHVVWFGWLVGWLVG